MKAGVKDTCAADSSARYLAPTALCAVQAWA